MLHGKHKKKCFLRSMGSTFSIFSTPPQPNCHFFLGKITAEGCQKWQIVIPTLREKQKKISFLRSMGSRFFTFVTPLDWYWHFWLDSPGSGRLRLAQAGSGWLSPVQAGLLTVLGLGGSGFSPTTRAGGQDYVSYTQTPSNYIEPMDIEPLIAIWTITPSRGWWIIGRYVIGRYDSLAVW